MENMDSRLNALLNDPNAMARIMELARQLSGGAVPPTPPPAPPPPPPPPQSSQEDSFDPTVLLRLLPLLQELRQEENSQTRQLLLALRPFLKPERQGKVERAVKLAHLIHIGKKFLTEGGLDLV